MYKEALSILISYFSKERLIDVYKDLAMYEVENYGEYGGAPVYYCHEDVTFLRQCIAKYLKSTYGVTLD